jgi:hypothetical protein
MGNISDESIMDLEKRKVYLQKYEFTLQGFLMDEDEFEITPAITRTFQIYETDTKIKTRKPKKQIPEIPQTYTEKYSIGNVVSVYKFNYTTNLKLSSNQNITQFEVYINDDFYGNDLTEIQISTGDELRITVTKDNIGQVSAIVFLQEII